MSALAAALQKHVDKGRVTGLVAAIESRDHTEVVTLGHTSLAADQPMAPDSIFRIASMTKPITAVATLLLIEDGTFAIDDPVDRFLPELANVRVLRSVDAPLDDTLPARRRITVRDLLTFRLGTGVLMAAPSTYPIQRALLELGQGVPPRPAQMLPPDEWMRRLGALPLIHQPGEGWLYHTGSEVLGILVRRACGSSLAAFCGERIFEPLGMVDTGFTVPTRALSRLTTSYAVETEASALTLYDPGVGSQWCAPRFESGGAGLVSTLADFLAFGRMLLAGGSHARGRLLREASVRELTTDQLTPADKARAQFVPHYFEKHGWGYGLAVMTQTDELRRPAGAFGWDGGLGTSWCADPATGRQGLVLTQRAWTSPIPPRVCQDFFRTLFA